MKVPARDQRLDRAIHSWVATLGSPSTAAAYRRDLELYARWLGESGLDARDAVGADIERFLAHCTAAGDGASTVNRRMSAVSSFYRDAAWANPVDGVERRTTNVVPTRRLSAAEVEAVWSAALAAGDKTAVVVGLVLLDGMKTKDILQLDVDDVRTRRGEVTVEGPSGVQAVDRRTAVVLRRHVARRDGGPLLLGESPTRAQARMTRFGVDYLVKRAGVRAGLADPLTVNAMRSTHASRQT